MKRKVAAFVGLDIKVAALAALNMNQPLFGVVTAKQGNPLKISSFSFHGMRDYCTVRRKTRNGVRDFKALDDVVSLFEEMVRVQHKCPAKDYNVLLTVIMKRKHYWKVIGMFKKLNLSGCAIDLYTMNIVVNCYCKLKQVELCFAILACFLKQGYAPDIVSITCLMKGLYAKDKVVDAQELFMKMVQDKGGQVDDITFSVVLNGLCKSGNIIQGVQLLEILEKQSCNLDIYGHTSLIDYLCEKILQQPKRPAKDYNKLLTVIMKKKHYWEVIGLFKQLSLLGCAVDHYTMNIVINCCCNLKEVEMGFPILASFLKQGYAPDIVSITSLIKGLFIKEKVGDAQELFKKMIKDKVCQVDDITFSVVLNGLCKSGNTVKAVEMLEVLEKQNCKLDTYGYTRIIDYLCKNGMVDDAMTLLSKMLVGGIPQDAIAYNVLIYGLCIDKRFDEARKLFKQMVNHKVIPDVRSYTFLVDAFCKEGLMKEAEDLVKIMTESSVHPDVYTYNALMDGYSLQGQPDKAKEVFDLMVDRGVQASVVNYGTIINGYCKQKKLDHAWKMFKEMDQKGLKPDAIAYSTMMQGLFSVGRCSDALKLFDDMKIVGHDMDMYTCGIILNGLLSNGLIEDAITFFHEVEGEGSTCHISFYNSFIHGLCNHRKLNLACSIFNNLSSKRLYPNVRTYTVMIKGLCQEGQHKEAKKLLEKMEQGGCFPSSVTYNTIIQGCLVNRDSQDSTKLLEQIAERDFSIDASTLNLLLQQMPGSSDDSVMMSLIKKLISRALGHCIASDA